MDALELLQRVQDRYMTAVVFHWESADLFHFLSLPGFAALHEYQFADESNTARRVKKYIIDNHDVILPDGAPEPVNIVEPLAADRTRFDLKSDDRWKAVQAAWKAYYEWERGTKEGYEDIAKALMDEGYVADSLFVKDLVQDVSDELAELTDIYLAMQGMEWDLPTITSMQLEMQEKWKEKLRDLWIQV